MATRRTAGASAQPTAVKHIVRRPRPMRDAVGQTFQATADIISTASVTISALKELGLTAKDTARQLRVSNQLDLKLEYLEDQAEFVSVTAQLGITADDIKRADEALGF